MEVIDAVAAYTLEIGDTISLGTDEVEIKEILDCDTPGKVMFVGYSLVSDMVKPYIVTADLVVKILGA